MHTTKTGHTESWYESPYGRLCERSGHRRPQPTVAQVLARLLGTDRGAVPPGPRPC